MTSTVRRARTATRAQAASARPAAKVTRPSSRSATADTANAIAPARGRSASRVKIVVAAARGDRDQPDHANAEYGHAERDQHAVVRQRQAAEPARPPRPDTAVRMTWARATCAARSGTSGVHRR